MAADHQAMEPALWHEALRRNDDAAHEREDAWMRANAVTILEQRLAQANADRHILREAVLLRDRILREQQRALAERDGLVSELHERLAKAEGLHPARHLFRRVVDRSGPLRPAVRVALGALRRVRRLLP